MTGLLLGGRFPREKPAVILAISAVASLLERTPTLLERAAQALLLRVVRQPASAAT